MSETREIVHACPRGDSGYTPCCNETPFLLPWTDRMTLDPALVTCRGVLAGSDTEDREDARERVDRHRPQSDQDRQQGGTAVTPPHGTCARPPRGWWCSRANGHAGPCPTRARWWNVAGLWRTR